LASASFLALAAFFMTPLTSALAALIYFAEISSLVGSGGLTILTVAAAGSSPAAAAVAVEAGVAAVAVS
jgi:hypothetical protein